MKKILQILLISTLLMSSFSYGFKAQAQISAFNIQITDIKNNSANLQWYTNEYVKSEIYYGLAADNLDTKLSYNTYKKNHQASLYGLEEDKNYYYQIILYSRSGEKLSIYPRSFSTDDMEDTRAPKLLAAKIIQTSGNAVAFSWQADEKVRAEVHYWKDGEFENKKINRMSSYGESGEYFLYNLEAYSKYYMKILIRDKAGNTDSKSFSVNIYEKFNKELDLQIRNIEPMDSNSDLVSAHSTTIKFSTNLVGKSYITYGTTPNRLNNKVYINDNELSSEHQVTLEDLEPGTIYYYNIYVSGSFYNKRVALEGLSFKTRGGVLGIKETAATSDSDHDLLSNEFEMSIGTNPSDPDSDNDGYRDGTEVINGYNPLGPGKWNKKITFFYAKPRIDLAYEQSKAQELKEIVDKKLPYIYINSNKWAMLVNAYVYGDYPSEAIVMYIKLDGYTVHPEISWHSWKDSPDYKKYEKYIK